MAYEVTATRKRPQQFTDLVGQEFVAATLKKSLETQKIAHAYLFTGPRGCGKTSTARILAKALNCKEGPTAIPCGKCTQCLQIAKGASIDVIEIDGASATSINDIRQIKDEILFAPIDARYKIYIIDEVHMLSNGAFNALLKTIEEPPPYVIFIFATTELHKVPATIKSRCQQFNFRLVAIESIKDLLAKAIAEIGAKAQDEALYWIARQAGGSIRDAYTLFDQVVAFSDNDITWEKIRDKLGLLGVERLNALFELCVKSDTKAALESLEDLIQNGISIEQIIIDCTDYIRNLLLIKAGVTRESLLGQSPERFCKIALEKWNCSKLEVALDLFLKLFRDIRYCVNQRTELELAICRLCFLNDYVSTIEVKDTINKAIPLLLNGNTFATTNNNQANIPTQTLATSTNEQVAKKQGNKPLFNMNNITHKNDTASTVKETKPDNNDDSNTPQSIKQAMAIFEGKVVSKVPVTPSINDSEELTNDYVASDDNEDENT